MKLDLIQPFINAADAVLSEMLQQPVEIIDLAMQQAPDRAEGAAASISLDGDIEGNVVFAIDPKAAIVIAAALNCDVTSGDTVVDVVCELANLIVGNAVVALNDSGFQFNVHPPQPYVANSHATADRDSEAVLMRFNAGATAVLMNISMRYCRAAHA